MRYSRTPRVPAVLPAGAPLVTATGVVASIGSKQILNGADIEVRAGEIVALAGPNGAGKSTLFGALAGDLPTSSGTILVDGAPISSWSLTELAQRRAVLPQQLVLSFPFLVQDVVAMGRSPWRNTPLEDEDEAAVTEALAVADVTEFHDRRFTSLSGGERAQVAFARVLAQRTQWLLLDEPTAALDIHHQEVLLEAVRARVKAGAGALVVMHDLPLAAAYADRIALMQEGRIVADGPPAQVLTPDLLSRVYEHDIEVITHPRTNELLVLPRR
jgi:iron complex transport system ATP-binding protein